MPNRLMHLGYSLAVPLLVLLVWQLSAQAGWVSTIVLPAPTAIFKAIFKAIFEGLRRGELIKNATASLARVLGGFSLGALTALPLGLSMGMFPMLHRLLNPVLQILRPIPPIAYIPCHCLARHRQRTGHFPDYHLGIFPHIAVSHIRRATG